MPYDIDEGTDALEFDEQDYANGAYFPKRGDDGVISYQRKPKSPTRMKGHGLRRSKMGYNQQALIDDMTMIQFKADMAVLWRDGETYGDIAEAINERYGLEGKECYNANDIHYHIKQMIKYWRGLVASRIDERQAMLLTRLDQIEQICIEAYFLSAQGRKTSVKMRSRQMERARSEERKSQLLEVERRKRQQKWSLSKSKTPLVEVPDDFSGESEALVETAKKIQEMQRNEENKAGDPKWMVLIFNINRERAKILGLYSKTANDDPSNDAARLTDEQRQQKLVNIINQAKQRRSEAVDTALATPAPLGGFPDPEVEDHSVPEVEQPEEEGWGFTEDEVDDITWD